MSGNESYYNNCIDQNFISWSASTSNSLFSIILLQFITYVIYKTSPIDPETFNIFSCFTLYLLVTCLIGLSVNGNSDCGQTYSLSVAFQIISYISIGVIVPFVIVKKVKKYRAKKQEAESQ